MPPPGRTSAAKRSSSSGSPKRMKRPPLHVPTARGLGLPYTGVAVDGARAADVVARQLPAVEAQAGGAWDLGCLYVGVNDVRALDFDPAAFARDHATALGFLAQRCERVLTATFP